MCLVSQIFGSDAIVGSTVVSYFNPPPPLMSLLLSLHHQHVRPEYSRVPDLKANLIAFNGLSIAVIPQPTSVAMSED